MVLSRCEIVDGHLDLGEIEQGVFEHHGAGRQPVLEIAVAQIVGMIGRRHPRRVGIPVQQIERRRRLALQVVVDDIGPDQVVRAQHVEGHRHPASLEHAGVLHVAFQRGDLVLVDEDEKIAGMGEVDLRGEEGCRGHALLTPLGEPGQRRGEQGAADAIAGGMHLHFAGHLLDDVHCGERAFAHVIGPGLLGELLVGIDPGDHEHGDTLIDAPFDVGFFGTQIEDVELVDPGRHDQQRSAQHALRGRRILDQLHQVVLVYHLARCRCHVDADHEIGRVGLADAQIASTGLYVLGQHLHAAHEVVALGL
ncbi:hypothetical protein ES703_84494 [subsurface metagenome]